MNIVELIRQQTVDVATRTAVIDGDRTLTYADLLARIGDLRDILAARGVGPGQRIAFHCRDGIDYVIGALALLKCGAAVVPVPDSLATSEVQETIDRIDVHGVMTQRSIVKQTAGNHTPIGEAFLWRYRDRVGDASLDDRCRAIDAAFIRFSSGTTGASKGVVLSHRAIIERTAAANRGLGVTSDDRVLWVLGMSHHFVVSILLFLRQGATIIVANQFFPFSVIAAAAKHALTMIYASPVHYSLLAGASAVKPETLAGVRLALSTSMKMPPGVSEKFASKFGLVPAEAYGIIEVGLPFINTTPDAASRTSVGTVLPDYELRIAAPDAGGVGEVLIKGRGMFDAYFCPWRLREEVAPDGWFDTGDLGRLDLEGRLHLVGRSKTVLVCAGMKVFPEEVEGVINTFPGVRESLVFGRDHAEFEQVPVANVVLNEPNDAAATFVALRAYCCSKLSSYKVPVEFVTCDTLPKTPSGKLARAAIVSPKSARS